MGMKKLILKSEPLRLTTKELQAQSFLPELPLRNLRERVSGSLFIYGEQGGVSRIMATDIIMPPLLLKNIICSSHVQTLARPPPHGDLAQGGFRSGSRSFVCSSSFDQP